MKIPVIHDPHTKLARIREEFPNLRISQTPSWTLILNTKNATVPWENYEVEVPQGAVVFSITTRNDDGALFGFSNLESADPLILTNGSTIQHVRLCRRGSIGQPIFFSCYNKTHIHFQSMSTGSGTGKISIEFFTLAKIHIEGI
jgi:hypothetical protein